MELRDYLHVKEIPRKQFAEKIRYNYAYLCRVAAYIQKPSRRLAEAIERETEGHVTVNELLYAKYDRKL